MRTLVIPAARAEGRAWATCKRGRCYSWPLRGRAGTAPRRLRQLCLLFTIRQSPTSEGAPAPQTGRAAAVPRAAPSTVHRRASTRCYPSSPRAACHVAPPLRLPLPLHLPPDFARAPAQFAPMAFGLARLPKNGFQPQGGRPADQPGSVICSRVRTQQGTAVISLTRWYGWPLGMVRGMGLDHSHRPGQEESGSGVRTTASRSEPT